MSGRRKKALDRRRALEIAGRISPRAFRRWVARREATTPLSDRQAAIVDASMRRAKRARAKAKAIGRTHEKWMMERISGGKRAGWPEIKATALG